MTTELRPPIRLARRSDRSGIGWPSRIVVAPSLVANAAEDGPILRLRVLRAALSAGQLHELLRAQLHELVGGDDVCLDAMADRLTAALLVGDPG